MVINGLVKVPENIVDDVEDCQVSGESRIIYSEVYFHSRKTQILSGSCEQKSGVQHRRQNSLSSQRWALAEGQMDENTSAIGGAA